VAEVVDDGRVQLYRIRDARHRHGNCIQGLDHSDELEVVSGTLHAVVLGRLGIHEVEVEDVRAELGSAPPVAVLDGVDAEYGELDGLGCSVDRDLDAREGLGHVVSKKRARAPSRTVGVDHNGPSVRGRRTLRDGEREVHRLLALDRGLVRRVEADAATVGQVWRRTLLEHGHAHGPRDDVVVRFLGVEGHSNGCRVGKKVAVRPRAVTDLVAEVRHERVWVHRREHGGTHHVVCIACGDDLLVGQIVSQRLILGPGRRERAVRGLCVREHEVEVVVPDERTTVGGVNAVRYDDGIGVIVA
jgi:hypothetical protein